jgi:hypothetical protein
MKTLRKLICPALIIVAAVTCAVLALATPAPLFVVTLGQGTTNTVTGIMEFSYQQPMQNATITHGYITNTTTAFYVNIYQNLPNSTATNGRVLIGTWYPTTTNAATETITGANFPYTNYLSFDVIATNAVPVSGSYGQ